MYTANLEKEFEKILDRIDNNIDEQDFLVAVKNGKSFSEYESITKYMSEIYINDEKKFFNNVGLDIYIFYFVILTIAYEFKGTDKEFSQELLQFLLRYPIKSNEGDSVIMYNMSNMLSYIRKFKNKINMLGMENNNSTEMDEIDKILDEFNFYESTNDGIVIIRKSVLIFLLFDKLYKPNRIEILERINQIEVDNGEFIWIEITIEKNDVMNFDSFYNNIKNNGISYRDAKLIFEMITYEDEIDKVKPIRRLIDSPFIIPISSDFIRIDNSAVKIKEDGNNNRLKIVINGVKSVRDRFGSNNNNLIQNSDREGIYFNHNEELKILNKMYNQDVITEDQNVFDFKNLFNTAYFPYSLFENDIGFFVNPLNRIDVLRKISIDKYKQKMNSMGNKYKGKESSFTDNMDRLLGGAKYELAELEFYGISCTEGYHCSKIGMVGISTNNTKKQLSEIKYSDVVEIIDINDYYIMVSNIIDTIFYDHRSRTFRNKSNNDNNNKYFFHMFTTSTTEDNINNFYQSITEKLYERLVQICDSMIRLNYGEFIIMLNAFSSTYKINITESDMSKLINEYYISRGNLVLNRNRNNNSDNDNDDSNTIDMPVYIKEIDSNPVEVISINMYNPLNVTEYVELSLNNSDYIKSGKSLKIIKEFVCKHVGALQDVSNYDSNNYYESINIYNKNYSKFINDYAIESHKNSQELICKYCSEIFSVPRYIIETGETEEIRFIDEFPNFDNNRSLNDYNKLIPKIYELTNTFIKLLNKNMNLNMVLPIDKVARDTSDGVDNNLISSLQMSKTTLDLITVHNEIMINDKNISDKSTVFVSSRGSRLEFFELSDKLIVHSKDDVDFISSRNKTNIIEIYTLFSIINSLDGSNIKNMYYNKRLNYSKFLEIKDKLFGNIYINNSMTNTRNILDYPILCYTLFCLSYGMIIYKLYYVTNVEIIMTEVKIIIQTYVDIIRSLIYSYYVKNNDQYVYKLNLTKFFRQLEMLSDNNLVESIMYHQDKNQFSTNELIEYNVPITYKKPSLKKKTLTNSYLVLNNYSATNKSLKNMFYMYDSNNSTTNRYYCENGSIHLWINKKCGLCNISLDSYTDKDLLENIIYFNLNTLALNNCIDNTLHIFNKDGICAKCGRSNEELVHLKLEDRPRLISAMDNKTRDKVTEEFYMNMYKTQINNMYDRKILDNLLNIIYNKKKEGISMHIPIIIFDDSSKIFNKVIQSIPNCYDKLINTISKTLNQTNVSINNETISFNENMYIIVNNISDSRDEIVVDESFIKNEGDMYFFVDKNRSGEKFYFNKFTLRPIVEENTLPQRSIKINYSMRNRLSIIAYGGDWFKGNINDAFSIAYVNIREMIENFSTIFASITNWTNDTPYDTYYDKYENNIIAKYGHLVNNNIDEYIFNDWEELKNSLIVTIDNNSSEAEMSSKENKYINHNVLDKIEIKSNMIMINYFVDKLVELINRTNNSDICYMICSIINNIYEKKTVIKNRNNIEYINNKVMIENGLNTFYNNKLIDNNIANEFDIVGDELSDTNDEGINELEDLDVEDIGNIFDDDD